MDYQRLLAPLDGFAETVRGLIERGYRGVKARSHRPDGQGVGLAIAMLLTRLHGGTLSLRAAPEGGCEALLQLPVHAQAGPALSVMR